MHETRQIERRVLSRGKGGVILNVESTKLLGNGTLGASSLQIGSQVAEVTKPLASEDDMVTSGMVVMIHNSGGIAKRFDSDSELKIRDMVKHGSGSEIVVERSGGSFTFETDVQTAGED